MTRFLLVPAVPLLVLLLWTSVSPPATSTLAPSLVPAAGDRALGPAR